MIDLWLTAGFICVLTVGTVLSVFASEKGAKQLFGLRSLLATAILALGFFLTAHLSFTSGQIAVRQATKVVAGEPYTGVYHGDCLWEGRRAYCAVESESSR